jgi:hypothetical protein
MKHLLQFLLLAGVLFVGSFGLNYFIIQADPQVNFDSVQEPVLYGCTMFSLVLSVAKLTYLPPKTKQR